MAPCLRVSEADEVVPVCFNAGVKGFVGDVRVREFDLRNCAADLWVYPDDDGCYNCKGRPAASGETPE